MISSKVHTDNRNSLPTDSDSRVNTPPNKISLTPDLVEIVLDHLDTKTLQACKNLSPDCTKLLKKERVWKKHSQNIIPKEIMALLPDIPSYQEKIHVFLSPSCQKIATALANADIQSDISLNEITRIFSEELIKQVKSHEGTLEEKTEMIAQELDRPRVEIAMTPILAALSSSTDKYIPLMEILLKAGANPSVEVENNKLSTPLHRAAFYASKRKVELLLKYGANPFLKNPQGKLPIEMMGGGLTNNPLLKKIYEKNQSAIKKMLLEKMSSTQTRIAN